MPGTPAKPGKAGSQPVLAPEAGQEARNASFGLSLSKRTTT